ncbi:putative membrane-associated kinase regulator 2 [Glycine soja]
MSHPRNGQNKGIANKFSFSKLSFKTLCVLYCFLALPTMEGWKAGADATLDSPDIDADTDADGPFFDLELAVPDSEEDDTNDNNNSDSASEKEFKLTLSPSTSSNDFIFNSQPNNSKPQFTASLFKSATKFRVFMLGLKKLKPNAPAAPNLKKKKLFTVKFKAEEYPIVSLFSRDNSSRPKASQNHHTDESQSSLSETLSSASEEKRLMRKYLKMVKPLYVRVSRRSEKVDVSSPESAEASTVAEKIPTVAEDSESANLKGPKQGNVALPAALRKHLGKGRSAAVAAPAPPSVSSKRRDDSLLQQHDWIQGAILHCKNSFNASTECETSQLPRSVSDISPELSENSKE